MTGLYLAVNGTRSSDVDEMVGVLDQATTHGLDVVIFPGEFQHEWLACLLDLTSDQGFTLVLDPSLYSWRVQVIRVPDNAERVAA